MATPAFLVLVLLAGNGSSSMTTMPETYPYSECKARGEDFISISPGMRRYFCIVAPDKR